MEHLVTMIAKDGSVRTSGIWTHPKEREKEKKEQWHSPSFYESIYHTPWWRKQNITIDENLALERQLGSIGEQGLVIILDLKTVTNDETIDYHVQIVTPAIDKITKEQKEILTSFYDDVKETGKDYAFIDCVRDDATMDLETFFDVDAFYQKAGIPTKKEEQNLESVLENAPQIKNPSPLDTLLYRLAYPPFAVEDVDIEEDKKQRLGDLKEAWEYLQTFSDEPLSEEKIMQVGNRVSESSPYISHGYRKIGSYLADTKTLIPTSDEIQPRMQLLIENYETTWKELEPLEREARFFLEMIRIHPFEDGNRRTAQLLVNAHLLEEGYAPVIISDDVKQEYFSSIDQNNVEGMVELFHRQSAREYERLGGGVRFKK